MKRKEAKRLRDIANVLDDQCSRLFYKDPKHCDEAKWLHFAANQIREVLMDGGFNGIVDEKYSKTKAKWEV